MAINKSCDTVAAKAAEMKSLADRVIDSFVQERRHLIAHQIARALLRYTMLRSLTRALSLIASALFVRRAQRVLELTEVYDPFDGYYNSSDFGEWC